MLVDFLKASLPALAYVTRLQTFLSSLKSQGLYDLLKVQLVSAIKPVVIEQMETLAVSSHTPLYEDERNDILSRLTETVLHDAITTICTVFDPDQTASSDYCNIDLTLA